jgi:hypothetical protein
MQSSVVKIYFYTSFALVAFAANSVLDRLALDEHTVDTAAYQ